MLDLTIKKPNAAAQSWLLNHKPDPDARQWMKFGTTSPIGFGGLILAFEREWFIDGGTKLALTSRIVEDAYIRLGREMASLGTPEFAKLSCLKPDFAFDYQAADVARDPKLAGKWRIAVQETTLDHLLWAAENGNSAAISVAAATFLAYYNNAKWPYLRTGGNPKQPYMNRGRCRTARGCLAYCRAMLTMLEYLLNANESKEHDFLCRLLDEHILRIGDHWPLVDDPAGDHLPVPFMSFYQTASLYDELGAVSPFSVSSKAGAYIQKIREWIQNMVPECLASPDGSRWYYDVAIVDGKPVWHESMAKQVTDVGGTAAWCAKLVRGSPLPQMYDTMLSQARALKWPEMRPDLMAQFFGTVK